MALSDIEDPPIVEVVCGFSFRAVEQLDPITLGAFWAQHRGQFPKRRFLPALREPSQTGFFVDDGLGPIRTWLISADEQYVLQLQCDRLYVNWRRRGDDYPSFSGRGGRPGLKSMALDHFHSFAKFVRSELGIDVALTGCELAKIDHLEEGRHWQGFSDLARLIKNFEQLARLDQVAMDQVAPTEAASWGPVLPVAFHLQFPIGAGDITVDARAGIAPPAMRILKLEFRRTIRQQMSVAEIENRLQMLNVELNGAFEGLLTTEAFSRFKRRPKP